MISSLASFCTSLIVMAQTPTQPIKQIHNTPSKLQGIANPSKNYSDKDGFMIVTTNDLTHQLKNLQKYVNVKKNHRNFNVFVVTENDYVRNSPSAVAAAKRNAPWGRVRGKEILSYLKDNYEKLNLKYVIFIGDARPDIGNVPMLRISHHKGKKNVYGNYNKSLSEIDEKSREKHKEMLKVVNPNNGQFTEHGSVVSDYPFVDLDSNWDANNDGFLDPSDDTDPSHTREAEVFVGRVPYYGENSKYGAAKDVDIILDRFIRYDTEKDISWRYNVFIEAGKDEQHLKQQFFEKNNINYKLYTRYKARAIGMPSINGKQGQRDISNFEKIQDYPVGAFGTHSHGGPTRMEGLSSKTLAAKAHDKWPTILSLGACDIGNINHEDNLIYTLLRFQSVAASGGTGSVTNYGGNKKYVEQIKGGKKELLWQGKSVGEAHWTWYSNLFKHKNKVPTMTACKINIYGDPSLVPFRYGLKAPYSFFAKPIAGAFGIYDADKKETDTSFTTTLSNNKNKTVTIKISTDKQWLRSSKKSVTLAPNQSVKISFKANSKYILEDTPTDKGLYYRANMTFTDEANNYSCDRPFVLKVVKKELKHWYTFEEFKGKFEDALNNGSFGMEKAYRKYMETKPKERPELTTTREGSKAYSPKQYGASAPIYIFEKEDFSINTWIKIDQENSKELAILKSTFLTLNYQNNGTFSGNIQNYAPEGSAERFTKDFTFKTNVKANQWHHYSFTLDQKKELLSIYVDAKLVHKLKVKKDVIYGTQKLHISKGPIAIDDLMIYNSALSHKEIYKISQDLVIDAPYPHNEAKFISNKNIDFKVAKGINAKNTQLYLWNQDQSDKIIIKEDENGNYPLPKVLEPNDKYKWYIASKVNGKTYRSKTWNFTAAKDLMINGNFQGQENIWGSDIEIRPAKAKDLKTFGFSKDNKKLMIAKDKKALAHFKSSLKPGEGSSFKGTSAFFHPGAKLIISAYASNGSKDILLASHRQSSKDREFKLNFKSPKDSSFKDLKIIMEHTNKSNNTKSRMNKVYVDDLSLVSFDAKLVNYAPAPVKDLDNLNLSVKTGTVGWGVTLDELIKDPEGGALKYSILSGPTWAFIQGQDLFSAFGPKEEDLGEATFTILAQDQNGNDFEFSIPVTVTK